MPSIGKVYPVAAEGSPLRSKKLFLVTLLLEAGYPLADIDANFEDSVDLATEKRTFVFVFDGGHRRDWEGKVLLPKTAADYMLSIPTDRPVPSLAMRQVLYQAYNPRLGATEALAELQSIPGLAADDFIRLREQHRILIDAVKQAPKHVIAWRGRARYWLPAELSAEQREREMDRIDSRYRSA